MRPKSPTASGHAGDRQALRADYARVRRFTEHLCEPLEVEDYGLQVALETSPPRWHLAHVSVCWEPSDTGWQVMTLGGMRALKPAEPACHLSYYEAEDFATWAGARLPAELELEHAAATLPVQGGFVEDGWLHPRPAPDATGGATADVRRPLGVDRLRLSPLPRLPATARGARRIQR